ncbi:MAG: SPOR domain-containing protein [Polyangiaceae bacterium]|nr:SPOR domain-containing protein [Polyangiaceae bacterium]
MRGNRDSLDTASVRNLDEIQESDHEPRPSRLGALVLASLGGACIVAAAIALLRAPAPPKPVATDPLGDLVAKSRPAGQEKKNEGLGQEVTFPSMLSDRKQTTALEAVRDPVSAASANATGALAPGVPTEPPAAADRLPVMPLPAQHVLTPERQTAKSDTLGAMAKYVAREDGTEASPAGTPGGFQLQVSSFKTQAEAEGFATALRRRGHKAYVEPAQVKGRGLWHRVRIGPFKYRRSAVLYRQDFEAKERLVTFIVDPPKTKVVVRDAEEE